jgi:N-acetylmuramoyl-L-alanine amidase
MDKSKRALVLALALLFLVNIVIIAAAQRAKAAVYQQGSEGGAVREIQQLLKNWGYYSGAVDGVFGSRPRRRSNTFRRPTVWRRTAWSAPDPGGAGIAGTRKRQPAEQRRRPHGQDHLGRSPGRALRGEGGHRGGDPKPGGAPLLPNTIVGVIYQPGAFSCLSDGQVNQPVADSAVLAAKEALGGADPSGGAIYYFNPATATSVWIWSRPLLKIIGSHRFCS